MFIILGIIVDLSVFSDSLNIDYIDIIKNILKEMKGKFIYDKHGISNIFDVVLTDPEISQNEIYFKFTREMKEVFVSQI